MGVAVFKGRVIRAACIRADLVDGSPHGVTFVGAQVPGADTRMGITVLQRVVVRAVHLRADLLDGSPHGVAFVGAQVPGADTQVGIAILQCVVGRAVDGSVLVTVVVEICRKLGRLIGSARNKAARGLADAKQVKADTMRAHLVDVLVEDAVQVRRKTGRAADMPEEGCEVDRLSHGHGHILEMGVAVGEVAVVRTLNDHLVAIAPARRARSCVDHRSGGHGPRVLSPRVPVVLHPVVGIVVVTDVVRGAVVGSPVARVEDPSHVGGSVRVEDKGNRHGCFACARKNAKHNR